MQRVRSQIGGVQLAGREAAELSRYLSGPDTRRVEDVAATEESDGGAAGGDDRPAARRVEAGIAHALPFHRERDADEVTAGGTAGRARAGAGYIVAPPHGRLQVLLEALEIHPGSMPEPS